MAKDPKHGGTEADGTRSEKFCSYCYEGGEFKQPDITLKEMKTLVKENLKEMGFPGFLAGLFTISIHKLDRWKNQ